MKKEIVKPHITTYENGNIDVSLLQEELSGGKISIEEIDSLKIYRQINRLAISGLNQETFEYLIHKYGSNFTRLKLFKNPKINDFSPIETLKHLIEIDIFWNQKAENLWDFEKNNGLEKIILSDIKKLSDLNDFSNNKTLKYIEINPGFTGTLTINTLKPLTTCQKLDELHISMNKLLDNDISPLSEIASLKKLYLPTNFFTTEQVAWLKAKCENKFNCDLFDGVVKLNLRYFGSDEYPPDTIIVGKRKPCLNSIKDKNKIEKYLKEFENMVDKYKLEMDLT